MTGRRSVAILALALGLMPIPARAQLLDKVLGKAEKAKQVAEKVGGAVVPISTEQEVELGRGIAATVAGYYGVDRDSTLTAYVNLVGTTVAGIDPRPDIAYRFAVLATDDVNAFAAPGGYVFVTRGALALMDDEAMLAGVLAHEVGHVDHKDVIHEIQSRARTSLGIQEAADRVDITGEEYLQKAIESGASALFMGLSREAEIAADTSGVRVASAAGYDPSGLRRFVERLRHADGEHISLFKKTHPDVDDRLKAIDSSIARLPADGRGDVVEADRFHAEVAARSAGTSPPGGG